MFGEKGSGPNYKKLREQMVDTQIASRGIRDTKVLQAMKEIPRHLFVPEESRAYAYQDHPLPIGANQTISQPYMVALMTEKLELRGDERVLEIGTGSGYQAAILSKLAKEVYTVETIASLSERCEKLFQELGYMNIYLKTGDGTEGWEEEAPFDSIVVTAGAPDIPTPLIRQLAEDSRIVIPVGNTFSQELIIGRKVGDQLKKTSVCGCVFVPLKGKYGWD